MRSAAAAASNRGSTEAASLKEREQQPSQSFNFARDLNGDGLGDLWPVSLSPFDVLFLLAVPVAVVASPVGAVCGSAVAAAHLVFTLHLLAVALLVLIPFIPWMFGAETYWQYWAFLLPLAVYLFVALRRVFRRRRWQR